MKTIAFAAAIVVASIAVSAAATPAFAAPKGRFGNTEVTYREHTDRYCFREAITGSLIPVTTCRSKAEWAQQGIVIHHTPAVQMAQR